MLRNIKKTTLMKFKKKLTWTLTKLKLNGGKNNQSHPPLNASNFFLSPHQNKYGIHGKQRGGCKGKWINPLTAQRNA